MTTALNHSFGCDHFRKVSIPDNRMRYLVEFLQKLDRLMTGLPVKVIVKDLPRDGTEVPKSKTDGKRIWLDWSVLRQPMYHATRLGLNAKELAHSFFGLPAYDRQTKKTHLKAAANILLEARDTTLFSMMYPSSTPYFVSMVQELLIRGRDISACHDVWPILYGMKFLPPTMRFYSAPKHDPLWVKKAASIIDAFVSLPPEPENISVMVKVTEDFSKILGEVKATISGNSVPVGFYNPGGDVLLHSKKIHEDVPFYVMKRIELIVDKDRGRIKKRVKLVKSGANTATRNVDKTTPTHRSSEVGDDEQFDVQLQYKESKQTYVVTSQVKHKGSSESPPTRSVVEVDETTPPIVDLELKTVHRSNISNPNPCQSPGSSGDYLESVDLIEVGEDALTKYVWVGDDDEQWDDSLLDKFKDKLTSTSAEDIIKSLAAEVLFDDIQLKNAAWDGRGAVTAETKRIRNRFESELKRAAISLRNRHGTGQRGTIHMKAAMKADRLPTSNIFREKRTHLTRNQALNEIVMLTDASGSMNNSIEVVMKTQWIIGSAFERIGSKVTVIPFNNVARDPLKGRDDKFSERNYPYCAANGGTQPHGALVKAEEIFSRCGSRFKILMILTDGAWNDANRAHTLIDKLNRQGVMTVLVHIGGSVNDLATVKCTKNHHCKESIILSDTDELLVEMRKTFFAAYAKSVRRTLRRYY